MDDNKPRKDPVLNSSAQAAADIARLKLNTLYRKVTNLSDENGESDQTREDFLKLSKHQKYMDDLTKSGKSLAEIQTAWHNYYANLSDIEKNEVWQEFYDQHDGNKKSQNEQSTKSDAGAPAKPSTTLSQPKRTISRPTRGKKLSAKQHLQSLLFGLVVGSITIVFILFGFFNERFIAPFISPSRNVSTTPIIGDPNSNVAGSGSRVIIPKINVEIPVIYDASDVVKASNAKDLESAIQKNLEDGVVHYPSTSLPGEKGNVAIVGHSSNNIFNQGKYKFAFVLLSKLEEGDTFYLTKDKVRYTYKIFKKKIVAPSDVSVLADKGSKSTATLITCDPPGTSLNRLIVVGEQISPSPSKNTEPNSKQSSPAVEELPSNAESLWSRFTNWLFRR
jgi:sortase A